MCAGGRSVPVVAVCNSNRKRNRPLIFRAQTLAKEQEKGKQCSVLDSTMGGRAQDIADLAWADLRSSQKCALY